MRAVWTIVALCLVAISVAAATASAGGRLDTAIMDTTEFGDHDREAAFARVRSAGAKYVRLAMNWRIHAPAVRPRGFDAADPDDPAYRWSTFDLQVKSAVANGLIPIISISTAPDWAEKRSVRGQPGTRQPSVAALGEFAGAAARRYSGNDGFPRVRFWQVWNEPNLNLFVTPVARSIAWYRAAVNTFAAGVKAVRSDNVVIAGGLAPFTIDNGYAKSTPPLRFMRDMLCIAPGPPLRRSCSHRVRFDVWSHHPYTAGGPTHQAYRPDDVSLGDLGEMRALLRAAARHGTIQSRGAPRFWVTEFSWDSQPSDPKGVPAALHARWVSEALYRMWQSGVSLVTWFTLRDHPLRRTPFQSGLWYRGTTLAADRPKPALIAFRFPFVAFSQPGRVQVWGRTPDSRAAAVVIEQRFHGGWRKVRTLRAGAAGIFQAQLPASQTRMPMRARIGTTSSRPFSLIDPGDRVYQPFGSN